MKLDTTKIIYVFTALTLLFGVLYIIPTIIFGERNVYTEPSDITIEIKDVKEGRGEKYLENLGRLIIRSNTSIKLEFTFPPAVTRFEGLALNLEVYLESETKNYVIMAPCIWASIECNRILVLIPGFDFPLSIEEGIYNISVKMMWNAEGEGDIIFTIKFIEYRDGERVG